MTYKDISKLRKKINSLDDKILNLIDERSRIVKKIGSKKDKSKEIIDINRENNIIQRLLKKSNGYYSKDSLIRVWREFFHASLKIQKNTKDDFEPKRGIQNIKVYKGGKSSAGKMKKIIKLSSNENSLKASSQVVKIFKNDNFLHRYGEISGQTLRKQLSKMHLIEKDQIVLGNGSNEILLMSAIAFCHPGDEIIHSQYGFEMYSIITKIAGAHSVIAEQEKYVLNLNSILKKINNSKKLILIDNPNNPTGTYIKKKNLSNFLSKVPKNIVVVIDGAYAEYVNNKDYDSKFSLVKKYENLIITRTFSKVYGLAGMRIGWCYTSKKIASILNKIKPPFNVNKMALSMASEALKDKKHLQRNILVNNKNRTWFQKELKKLHLKSIPSSTNFAFIECKKNSDEADKIFSILFDSGIIVRQLHSYGLPHCLRITIGNKEEMFKTVKILKKINFNV